ncbi:MAG: hypothetical protein C4543_07190 [Ignavibacteriales bacterium]|jgi:hypothetical protein|nr:MAG: hypothetical protein C4543_07190 [Ignavibacteriales bacterium]
MFKKFVFGAIIFYSFISLINAQGSYDYLVEYLPSVESFGKFTRSEIIIDDPCEQCLPTVTILYNNIGQGDIGEEFTDLGQTISLSLTDCIGASEYLSSMLEFGSESQTYLLVKNKYGGWKEIVENEFGIQQCTYTFAVIDRFLIQISGEKGNLTSEIESLINNIDLERLENF